MDVHLLYVCTYVGPDVPEYDRRNEQRPGNIVGKDTLTPRPKAVSSFLSSLSSFKLSIFLPRNRLSLSSLKCVRADVTAANSTYLHSSSYLNATFVDSGLIVRIVQIYRKSVLWHPRFGSRSLWRTNKKVYLNSTLHRMPLESNSACAVPLHPDRS